MDGDCDPGRMAIREAFCGAVVFVVPPSDGEEDDDGDNEEA
jgi:hypothetical protein